MSATLELNFLNNTSVEWKPDQNSDASLQKGGNSIISWPSAPLMAESGAATCEITDNLEKLEVITGDFYFCWNDGTWRFGVKVVISTQLLDMGAQPSWQIMYDQDLQSSNIQWQSSGSTPGNQYTWPTEIGYSIVATPTSTHQGLTIQVRMNNLPQTS